MISEQIKQICVDEADDVRFELTLRAFFVTFGNDDYGHWRKISSSANI